tara:strand:+ start:387 stop:1124 length:738 start_codon:yes stop_codon:yes gene_type:complete
MKIIYKLFLLILFIVSSCTKSPEELLKKSEHNIENAQIDMAINNLRVLLKKHPNDSLSSKAQYKLASLYLNWKNNPSAGFAELKNTVTNYGKSLHGKQAKEQIDEFPEYIINKAESLRKQNLLKDAINHLMFLIENYSNHDLASKGQYMMGDIYMNDFRDFTTAIQEYRKVLEKYVGSDQEPHALFMIGYIYANIINDENSAKIEYQKFLSKFPNHELSPSVKFEIDYLGKSIEEIPALKHITTS